jgi:hypothetical protein
MRFRETCLAVMVLAAAGNAAPGAGKPDGPVLGVVAVGDAGETGGALRGTAQYASNMYGGLHDAGPFQLLLFLGDNFYPTGLNIPPDDVEGTVKSVLTEPFHAVLDGLGTARVHAVPGNHDYYARNALQTSFLFGLIKLAEAPMGLSGRGNQREAAIPQWTYHAGMPAEIRVPLAAGASDSVAFIFFDSAPLLRSDPPAWRPVLDSLRRLLTASRAGAAVRWRVLCMHHPLATVGEHGGYGEWDDETKSVARLTTCDRDSNALGWVKNLLDPEDLCTDRYRAYVDSIRLAIRTTGVPIQVVLSGHDHSLQLLRMPAAGSGPRVQIVSGAGSLASRVRFPEPPGVYTSARLNPEAKGESVSGFVHLQFDRDRLRVRFFNSANGDQIDMGGGAKGFVIDTNGDLTEER